MCSGPLLLGAEPRGASKSGSAFPWRALVCVVCRRLGPPCRAHLSTKEEEGGGGGAWRGSGSWESDRDSSVRTGATLRTVLPRDNYTQLVGAEPLCWSAWRCSNQSECSSQFIFSHGQTGKQPRTRPRSSASSADCGSSPFLLTTCDVEPKASRSLSYQT